MLNVSMQLLCCTYWTSALKLEAEVSQWRTACLWSTHWCAAAEAAGGMDGLLWQAFDGDDVRQDAVGPSSLHCFVLSAGVHYRIAPPLKCLPGRQFTGKNLPARAGQIFAGKLSAVGEFSGGGAIFLWGQRYFFIREEMSIP